MPSHEPRADVETNSISASGTHASTSSERLLPLAVLGSLPLILLAMNTDWIYSDHGLIDPWLYHGYFHRFPEFVSTLYPGTYYGTRLAWILPGYAAYHLLNPYAANMVLHLTFYYAALFALYRAAVIVTTRSAALLSATAFGTATPTIVAFGWDYIDGAVIAYTLVAIWAVLESSLRRRRSPFLFVAGAAAACIVHSNLAAVLLGPPIVIAYWFSHRTKHWSDAGIFVGGGLIATAVMGLIDMAAGGPFLFFMDSVRWANVSLGTQTFIPVAPLKWPGSARFVVPLVGVCAAAGAFLARRTTASRMAALMLLWLIVAFLFYDGVLSGGMLQIQYYVSWFLALSFLGLAVALAPMGLTVNAAAAIAVSLAVVQGTVLLGAASAFRDRLSVLVGNSGLPAMEIALAGAALAGIVFVALRARRSAQAVVVVVAMVVADFVATPNLGYRPTPKGPSQFAAVQQTLAFIGAHVPRESPLLFWVAPGTPNSPYYASLASTHLYLYSLLSVSYPRLRDESGAPPAKTLVPGDYLLITADTKADPGAVNAELQLVDMRAAAVAWAPVRTKDADFALTLFRIDR